MRRLCSLLTVCFTSAGMVSQLALVRSLNILGLTDTTVKRLSSTYLPKNFPMASSWAKAPAPSNRSGRMIKSLYLFAMSKIILSFLVLYIIQCLRPDQLFAAGVIGCMGLVAHGRLPAVIHPVHLLSGDGLSPVHLHGSGQQRFPDRSQRLLRIVVSILYVIRQYAGLLCIPGRAIQLREGRPCPVPSIFRRRG